MLHKSLEKQRCNNFARKSIIFTQPSFLDIELRMASVTISAWVSCLTLALHCCMAVKWDFFNGPDVSSVIYALLHWAFKKHWFRCDLFLWQKLRNIRLTFLHSTVENGIISSLKILPKYNFTHKMGKKHFSLIHSLMRNVSLRYGCHNKDWPCYVVCLPASNNFVGIFFTILH